MNWQQPTSTTIQVGTAAQEAAVLHQLQKQLGPEWELKILHSASHAFANAEHVTAATMQEARAGWQVVQQWDDSRLLFKRPVRVRETATAQASLNPYRETYAAPVEFVQTLIGALLLLGTLIGLAIVLGTNGV